MKIMQVFFCNFRLLHRQKATPFSLTQGLSTQCLVAEPQGSHQVVAIEIDDKLVKIIAPALPKIRSAETVHLAFNQEAISFFDKDTSLRI